MYSASMAKAHTNDSSDVRDNILAVGQRIMSGKGFSAVGLNEILTEAKVPKGSFYHYFESKDAFGEALLSSYFEAYLAELDAVMAQPGLTMAQRLLNYFDMWRANQSFLDCQGKCLAVKLAAEVADLSEAMRGVLNQGTSAIVARLNAALERGVEEGSLAIDDAPKLVAESLYQLWLGASVMVKIVRGTQPFDSAMAVTRQILHLAH
jgi:TetR/AcrR family transcriptional repressor of nem operon